MPLTTKYTECTAEELRDVCAHIDKERYPERYNEVMAQLGVKEAQLSEQEQQEPAGHPKLTIKQKFVSMLAPGAFAVWLLVTGSFTHRRNTYSIEDTPLIYWLLVGGSVGLFLYFALDAWLSWLDKDA